MIDILFIEHEEFKKKRKEHYKNEFNPAMLLKAKSVTEDDEEEEGKGVWKNVVDKY